jgi:hypothetical protein
MGWPLALCGPALAVAVAQLAGLEPLPADRFCAGRYSAEEWAESRFAAECWIDMRLA